MKPTSASLLLAEDCNMACTYCFEKNKPVLRMTDTVAILAISRLFKNSIDNSIATGHIERVHIMFFGGEPLLNYTVLFISIQYGIHLSLETSVPFSFSIVTNGTLIDERFISFIESMKKNYPDIGMTIQFSIDGVGHVHDQARIFSDGSGTFDVINTNLEMFYSRIADISSIHECVSHKTVGHVFESFIYFYEHIGCNHQWFMPINDPDFNQDDVATYEEQMMKIVDYLYMRKDWEALRSLPPISSKLECHSTSFKQPCGAGNNFCSITANGDIFPCHEFYYNDQEKETKLGNITEDIDQQKQKIYIEYDSRDLSCHGKNGCDHSALCYICIADNYMNRKNILSHINKYKCAFTSVEYRIREKGLEYLKESQDVTNIKE